MNRTAAANAKHTSLPAGLALWAILALGWWIYTPGLSGSFLFDDWINLPPLGAHGPIDSWNTFITYLLSGISSATGRPLAMLSFLIDANNWPAVAEPFKYTNILIHLFNGALLAWLAFSIVRVLGTPQRRAAWIAVLAAGLWLLHPLWVSTTLFVVQRMTMLAATFVLCGLLCYMHGRARLAAAQPRQGYFWATFGIVGFGLLAVLSKENGVLLPLFVLLLETILLQHPSSTLRIAQPTRAWRIWKSLLLYLPLLLIGAYLLIQLPGMLRGYGDVRSFTLGERLLTEARVVVNYLYLLVIPHAHTSGLYNDDIRLSTSVLQPWTTLPSIALLAGLLALALYTRKRQPLLSFGILFYFCGQLLESTFIPLELYFEHRNYLPAMFLALPLAYWLATPGKLPARAGVVIGVALMALLAGFTWARASLWGQPLEQAVVWARANPDSPRAQTTLALHLMHHGLYRQAAEILQRTAKLHPNNIMLELNLVTAQCKTGGISDAQFARTRAALSQTRVGGRVAYNAIGKFMQHYKTAPCAGLNAARLDALIDAALRNPHVKDSPGWLRDMTALRGELRLAEGKPHAALALFEASLDAGPDPGAALYEASLLGSSGHPRLGLELLDHFASLPVTSPSGLNVARLRAAWLRHIGYYANEIKRIRGVLADDLADRARAPDPGSRTQSTSHSQ